MLPYNVETRRTNVVILFKELNKFRSMVLSVRISIQYTCTGILEVTRAELQAFDLI